MGGMTSDDFDEDLDPFGPRLEFILCGALVAMKHRRVHVLDSAPFSCELLKPLPTWPPNHD